MHTSKIIEKIFILRECHIKYVVKGCHFWDTKNVKVLIEIIKKSNQFLFINIVYLTFILSRSSLSTLHKN